MKREASAVWQGGLKTGNGRVSTGSPALQNVPYSFPSRFQTGPGTNPEELIAAAHSACYSMALSHELEQKGFLPKRVETKAIVTLEPQSEGWTITNVHLDLSVHIPGIDQDTFSELAQQAKENCPISRLLKAPITLSAQLDASNEAEASKQAG